jgi:hypothetical protein
MDNNMDKLTQEIKSNINLINIIQNHFKILFNNNIINNDTYNNLFDKLKSFNNELNFDLKILNVIEKINYSDFNNNIIEIKEKDDSEDENESNEKNEKKNDEIINNKIANIKINTFFTNSELIQFIYEYGLTTINLVLSNIDNSIYLKNEIELNEKIFLINNFFIVTKVEKTISKKSDNFLIKIKNLLPNKSSKSSSSDDEDINKSEDKCNNNISINIIYELNKAIIEIELYGFIYKFNGFFKEDIFNDIYQNELFELKFSIIKKKLFNLNNKDEKFINFFKEYMMQISIKDLFICDIGEIIKKINTTYALLNRIEKLSIIDILDEFIKSDIYQKRNIVIVLLINERSQEVLFNNLFNKKEEDNNYDELLLKFFKIDNSINDVSFENNIREYYKTLNNKTIIKNNSIVKTNQLKLDKIKATKYTIESITRNLNVNNEEENLISILSNSKKILNANILMDFLKNNLLKSQEYENFKNSIHWNCRKKIFAKSNLDVKPNSSTEEMNWETKLNYMSISAKAKDKVMEKIKEVKNSKDRSSYRIYKSLIINELIRNIKLIKCMFYAIKSCHIIIKKL